MGFPFPLANNKEIEAERAEISSRKSSFSSKTFFSHSFIAINGFLLKLFNIK